LLPRAGVLVVAKQPAMPLPLPLEPTHQQTPAPPHPTPPHPCRCRAQASQAVTILSAATAADPRCPQAFFLLGLALGRQVRRLPRPQSSPARCVGALHAGPAGWLGQAAPTLPAILPAARPFAPPPQGVHDAAALCFLRAQQLVPDDTPDPGVSHWATKGGCARPRCR
jgi:hypothetical protein